MANRSRRQKIILPHRKLIGDSIRRFRRDAKLTQESLAERAELNLKCLGEIERGEKVISIEALMRIAKAVKMPVADFLRGI